MKCLLFSRLGLADYGHSFGAIDLVLNPQASLEIPPSIGCDKEGHVIPMYFASYRKSQLFMDIPNEIVKTKKRQFLQLIEMDTKTSYEQFKQVEDDICRVGQHYENVPILTAVIIKYNDSTEFICSNEEKKGPVMATLRYSTENVRNK